MSQDFKLPDYYHLPPFFTIQPVHATRTRQFKMWIDFIVQYLHAHKKSSISVAQDAKSELFCNQQIERSLSPSNIQLVLDELCKEGFGEWADDKHTECVVSWKKFQEWADLLYKYALDNDLSSTVCTLYELYAGNDAKGQEFYGIDPRIVYAAVKVLAKQGKASIIPGDSLPETGVKFKTMQAS